ncbi:MAG: S41 family peptidase [Polyangiales bacterium]
MFGRALPFLLLSASCGAQTASHPAPCPTASVAPSASVAAPPVFPDATARRVLLRELVADIRRLHVFAPQTAKNLGRTFDDDLPEIEREIAAADSKAKLQTALRHLGFALHDSHASYIAVGRESWVALPLRFGATWDGSAARFYVSRVVDPKAVADVQVGDVLVSVDGVPAAELLKRHALESPGTNWRTIGWDVARHLAVRDGASGETQLVLADAKGKSRTLVVSWRPIEDEGWDDFAVGYAKDDCLGRPAVDYGSNYTLTAVGRGFCLYVSTEPKHRRYPVVRYVSFFYGAVAEDPRSQVRADHDSLRSHLAQVAGLEGILLDLRDNHGGNNANWFLDMFAPGPYVDHFFRIPAHPELTDALLEPTTLRGSRRERYLSAVSKGGDVVMPPRCRNGSCDWDNRYVPLHRVADVPTALISGGTCGSSCDVFAQIFDEYDFGPLVGETMAAGYPGVRYRREVRTKEGELLGALTLMFGLDVSGKSKQELEGVPLHIDVPLARTIENLGRYDAMLADASIKALQTWKPPAK